MVKSRTWKVEDSAIAIQIKSEFLNITIYNAYTLILSFIWRFACHMQFHLCDVENKAINTMNNPKTNTVFGIPFLSNRLPKVTDLWTWCSFSSTPSFSIFLQSMVPYHTVWSIRIFLFLTNLSIIDLGNVKNWVLTGFLNKIS